MRQPNILILYTDQQRWDALGVNGNLVIHTPRLDQLASEGVNCDHYFVNHPVCMPSRVSFLAGKYPSTLGIYENGVEVPQDWTFLPHMLRNHGYRSANIGKLHFRNHANRDHRHIHPAYGFDHLEIADEPGCYEDAFRAWVRRVAPDQLDHISYGLPPAAKVWHDVMRIQDHASDQVKHPDRETFLPKASASRCTDDVTHTAFVATRTIDFIQSQQHTGQPFLAIAGFYSPHSPWIAPQRYLDLYDPADMPLPAMPDALRAKRPDNRPDEDGLRDIVRGYYAMVSEVDHHCGRVLDTLDKTGQADNTIVLFISDHGEWLGEHWRFGKGYPGHDPVSRVPCIIRWPGHITEPGRTYSGILEAVDVLPTLLEAAGIPVVPDLQGQSFTDMLERDPDAPGRTSALIEFRGSRALRTRDHLYVAHDSGRECLYDNTTPMGAYHDLSGDPQHAATLADMRHQLLQRLIAAAPVRPRDWTY